MVECEPAETLASEELGEVQRFVHGPQVLVGGHVHVLRPVFHVLQLDLADGAAELGDLHSGVVQHALGRFHFVAGPAHDVIRLPGTAGVSGADGDPGHSLGECSDELAFEACCDLVAEH